MVNWRKKRPQPEDLFRSSDTFCDAWGGSTKWKSGLAIGLVDTKIADPTRIIARESIARAATIPDLNKPLPPLPPRSSSSPSQQSGRTSHRTLKGTTSQLKPCSTSSSSEHAYFQKKRTAIFWPTWTRNGNKSKNHSPAPRASFVFAPPAFVDRGTQTDFCDAETDSTRTVIRRSPVLQHKSPSYFSQSYSVSDIPTNSATSSPISSNAPGSPLKTTWWDSPLNAVSDYFLLPTKDRINRDSPTNRRQSLKPTNSTSELLALVPSGHSSRPHTDESQDSVGTYESRYSSRQVSLSRESRHPLVTRGTASESSVPTLASLKDSPRSKLDSSPPKSAPHPIGFKPRTSRSISPNRNSNPSSGSQIMAHSVPQSTPFFSNRVQQSLSSDTSGSSPLRIEYKEGFVGEVSSEATEEQPQSSLDPAFYRVQNLEDPRQPDDIDYTIPDHLKSSPLCPLHPRNASRGMGICPQHGRRRMPFDSESSEESESCSTPRTPALQRIAPFTKNSEPAATHRQSLSRVELTSPMERASKAYPPAKKVTLMVPKSLPEKTGEAAAKFKLDVPAHSADSPLCPAKQPGGKGLCVLHGRDKTDTGD